MKTRTFIIIVVLALFALVWFTGQKSRQLEEECKSKNGLLLRGGEGYVCIRAEEAK